MYNTVEELEAVGFQSLEQDNRLAIILEIIDRTGSIVPFQKYFLQEDMDILKARNKEELRISLVKDLEYQLRKFK